ncbi:MAG TPA: right-handed parallel beta-helix repeat-containing protein [Candidatus Paceibacterota bacterium]|nr:right-handed parallel beta-helix repeat-containing protein [Candidatus Paceibacterota bacterium]
MSRSAAIRSGFIFIIGSIIFLLSAIPALAANWYVDNAVSTSGTGASWESAWKSFSDIVWSSIGPNDTLYISGGNSEKIYYETLSVGTSGSSGSPVTITKGIDSGHNGTVILDGENSRIGVVLYARDNIVVQNLNIQNIAITGISVKYATEGVVIQNNSVYSGMGPPNGTARGYDVRNSSGTSPVIVRNNTFTTPSSTTAQTDGMWSSGNNGVVFDSNRITISNGDSYGHSDGFQSLQDTNIIIRNNFFSHPNGGLHNHGMWLEDASDTITIYNNVVHMPTSDEQGITYWNEPGYSGRALMWNNTVYGAWWCYRFISAPNSQLKNNICFAGQGEGVVIENGPLSESAVNNNLIWSPNGTIGSIDWVPKTWTQWQAFGYDIQGTSTDPLFRSVATQDFTLATSSPAINGGQALLQVTSDKNGVTRPQGASYDMGAYEYVFPPSGPTTVFFDSFESGISLWTQDTQKDWASSTQRASNGIRSAEVDGSANNALLISPSINLSTSTQATITFSWYIESGLDSGEYIAFDVSTNGGSSWTERARLRGNQDPENSWRTVSVSVQGGGLLKLRFKGTMSDSTEDANVDNVRIVAQ